ncbi:hypothetical protein U1Q18_040399, partial [Sarracenia purpurea var. burkii]
GRIPCPHPGRIWLEQRGLQRALYWHIEARVVLDLQELLNSVSLFSLNIMLLCLWLLLQILWHYDLVPIPNDIFLCVCVFSFYFLLGWGSV